MPEHRKSPSPSVRWPLLLTLLPLIPLGAVIYLGMESQRTGMVDAGDRLAAREAQDLAAELSKATATPLSVPKYPDPPVPGVASPLDQALDSTDDSALLAVQRQADAGISPAGLPRRALAATRRLELRGPGAADDELYDLITRECPSILTGTILRKAGLPKDPARHPLAADWGFAEQLPAIAKQHPSGGWIALPDGSWFWLREEEGSLQFVPPATVQHLVSTHLPDQYAFRLTTRTLLPRIGEAREMAAAAPVPEGGGLRVEAYFGPQNPLQEEVARSQRWGWSIVAAATAVLGGGLWLVYGTLRRERKLNEMKSQFVASVSHELRSPVASIRLMAEALDAGKVEEGTAKEFHRLIAREGARLSTLVGNVLDHARIEQGRKVWKIEPCNLAELTRDTVRVMEPLAAEKKITLETKAEALDSAVDADAIQQALVNLLDNAIKFSPEGSSIGIALVRYEKGRSWELRVSDHGPGVPKREQSRIFERFYRPGDELRRESQGTGIGLNLVKSIAEAHGGRVWVESEPGKGSAFILQIPLA